MVSGSFRPEKTLTPGGNMLYWGIVYYYKSLEVEHSCPFMNIAVKIVVKRLKKGSAFPKPTLPRPVRNVKVKILTKNYPRLLHSEDYRRVRLVHPAAAAVRAGALAELGNLLPVVYRLEIRTLTVFGNR
jgi:hypothetical protein